MTEGIRIKEALPNSVLSHWLESGMRVGKIASPKVFRVHADGLLQPYSVICCHENIATARQEPDWRWHVSVAHPVELPTWTHFSQIVHEVRPGVMFCQPLPPPQFWLNLHDNCLHAWEIHDLPLTTLWREEGRGDPRS